jgi:hypothetical protein
MLTAGEGEGQGAVVGCSITRAPLNATRLSQQLTTLHRRQSVMPPSGPTGVTPSWWLSKEAVGD